MKKKFKTFLVFFVIALALFLSGLIAQYAQSESDDDLAPLKVFDPFEGFTVSVYVYDDHGRYNACNALSHQELELCMPDEYFQGGHITDVMTVVILCEKGECIAKVIRTKLHPEQV